MGSDYQDLTIKQQEILEFIKDRILSAGYPPSVREIGEAVGLSSTASVHSQLSNLEKKGYIRRDPTKSRTIEITDDEFGLSRREFVNVPMVGRVAAGEPILARQNIRDYFPIPVSYMPNVQTFMLRIKGDSMINAGIMDGDNVIVRQQNTANDGDIVIALIGDSATVKTLRHDKDGVLYLQPENDALSPIYPESCEILGVVFGVFRFF